DRSERLRRERRSRTLHHVDARLANVPLETDAGRLQDAARRLRELGAGAVAGDQGNAVRHRRAPAYTCCSRGLTGTGRTPSSVRSAPMSTTDFRPGLEGVIAFETEIAEPDKDGGALRYRGIDIEELVGKYPFENVWGLLVDEDLNSPLPPSEAIHLQDPSGSVPADLQAALA